MTPRENMLAVYRRKQPDYYGDFMDAVVLLPDPMLLGGTVPRDGKRHKDLWGTEWESRPGIPGQQRPVITEENKVISDITKWQEQVKVPKLAGLNWAAAKEKEAAVNREEKFAGVMIVGGIFERSYFLLGMADALAGYIEYPAEMTGLLREIADYMIQYIRLASREVHPDILFLCDNWGNEQNLFLPPSVWRRMIKPLQKEIADAIHDCGMMYMHHAACFCQPIALDMVEIGIDIWQGITAQNDIAEIQRETGGKLALAGGVNEARINSMGMSERELRDEVDRVFDTYCPAGRFYPGFPNGRCRDGWSNTICRDELWKYGCKWAALHRI